MWLTRGLTGQLPAVGHARRQIFPFIPEINKNILHAVVKWHAGLPVKQGIYLVWPNTDSLLSNPRSEVFQMCLIQYLEGVLSPFSHLGECSL